MSRRKNKKYSVELKLEAVQDYLNGGGSLREICRKYEISDIHVLRDYTGVFRHSEETIHNSLFLFKPYTFFI